MEWSEKRDRSLPIAGSYVSGGASCQSSACNVLSFMALWGLFGVLGLHRSSGSVLGLHRSCGQQEWTARGACRGSRAAAAPTTLALKCSASAEMGTRPMCPCETRGLRSDRPPRRRAGGGWCVGKRSARRRCEPLPSASSASRPNGSERAARCRHINKTSRTAAARDRRRRDRGDPWLPAQHAGGASPSSQRPGSGP